jgi:hypothetical protein
MLLKDVLAQTFGFVLVRLTQLVGVKTLFGFTLKAAAQCNPFIA